MGQSELFHSKQEWRIQASLPQLRQGAGLGWTKESYKSIVVCGFKRGESTTPRLPHQGCSQRTSIFLIFRPVLLALPFWSFAGLGSFILKPLFKFCQKIRLYLLLDRVAYVPWSFDDDRGEESFCATPSSPQCHCPVICPCIFFEFLLSLKGINMMLSPIKRSFQSLPQKGTNRSKQQHPGNHLPPPALQNLSHNILRCCFPQSRIGLDIQASLGGSPGWIKRLITLHFGKEKWELDVAPVHVSSLFSGQVKCQG